MEIPEKGTVVRVKKDINRNLIIFYEGWIGKVDKINDSKIFINFKNIDKDDLPFPTNPEIKFKLNPVMVIDPGEFHDILEVISEENVIQ